MTTNGYQPGNGEITVMTSYDEKNVFITVLDKSPGSERKSQTVILTKDEAKTLAGILA